MQLFMKACNYYLCIYIYTCTCIVKQLSCRDFCSSYYLFHAIVSNVYAKNAPHFHAIQISRTSSKATTILPIIYLAYFLMIIPSRNPFPVRLLWTSASH